MTVQRQGIPVLTLWQPWASWIAWGWKTIETRTHDRLRSLEGKRLLIHAGQAWDAQAWRSAVEYLPTEAFTGGKGFYERGRILCAVTVQEVRLLKPEDSAAALIDCGAVQRHGLILTDLKLVTPVPAKGRQGIWYYNGEVEI